MGYLRSSSLLKYFLDIFPYRFVIDVVLAQFEIKFSYFPKITTHFLVDSVCAVPKKFII